MSSMADCRSHSPSLPRVKPPTLNRSAKTRLHSAAAACFTCTVPAFVHSPPPQKHSLDRALKTVRVVVTGSMKHRRTRGGVDCDGHAQTTVVRAKHSEQVRDQ
ncbi:DNA-directed RNA polymerase subunit K [Sesbania bispinosa]|nr:DNA-directed RNA polymerase subunit K [Sesbania bispinosa]